MKEWMEKHPKATQWIREGGLFIIFSYVVTFKSHDPLPPQILCHLIAAIVVFLVMNLFTCIWNPVTMALIANEDPRNIVSSIVTAVVKGGVSMVIIFLVDKKIFAPGFGDNKS